MVANWREIIELGLRPRYSFCVWLTCILILGVPFPAVLRLDEIRTRYAAYLTATALFTFIVWVVELVLFRWNSFVANRIASIQRREVIAQLDSLSPDELFLLARAVILNVQTVRWKSDHDEVHSLVAKGLITPVPHDGTFGSKPYTVPRFVWAHLVAEKSAFLERARKLNPGKGNQLCESAT